MSNTETALRFVRIWQQNPQRVLSELQSLHNETHRKPDPYSFLVSEEGLIDQKTGRRVSEFIKKTGYLGSVEYGVFRQMEAWADSVNEGIAIWISPPFPGEYPCSKTIISKIAYTWEGQKVLLNSAILFDANSEQILEIIPKSNINNPEELRRTLFLFDDNDTVILDILQQIQRFSEDQPSGNGSLVEEQKAEVFAEMIKNGVHPWYVVQEMKKSGFLGTSPISCPPSTIMTFSDFMLSRSQILIFSETSKFVKNCGSCGAEINAHICKGFKCKSCGGVYEGC